MNLQERAINTTTDRVALIEDILMRAAEQIGDVTPPAIEAFYRQHPAARAAFESLSLGSREQLEGQMVENSLYCLMRWFESPGEITIMLQGSVPHHDETLRVPADWYRDLIECTAESIAETIPAENLTELNAWSEVRQNLRSLVERGRALITPHA